MQHNITPEKMPSRERQRRR